MVDLAANNVWGVDTLNAKETCEELGIKYVTLRKWMREGKIKSKIVLGYMRGFDGKEVARIKSLMNPRRGWKSGKALLPLKKRS